MANAVSVVVATIALVAQVRWGRAVKSIFVAVPRSVQLTELRAATGRRKTVLPAQIKEDYAYCSSREPGGVDDVGSAANSFAQEPGDIGLSMGYPSSVAVTLARH